MFNIVKYDFHSQRDNQRTLESFEYTPYVRSPHSSRRLQRFLEF